MNQNLGRSPGTVCSNMPEGLPGAAHKAFAFRLLGPDETPLPTAWGHCRWDGSPQHPSPPAQAARGLQPGGMGSGTKLGTKTTQRRNPRTDR